MRIFLAFLLFAFPAYADTFNTFVISDADDGDESSGSWVDDVYTLFGEYDSVLFHTGIRFDNITVPKGSTINEATITLYQWRISGIAPTGAWRAVASDDAPQFNGTRPTTASGTTASEAWVSTENTTGFPAPVEHDVTSIVQEIVNRSGWSSGNAINFYAIADVKGEEAREQWMSFSDELFDPPELDIDYTAPSGWTGTVTGVSNPAKVMGVSAANIAKVDGVE